ncbi:MAG: hypothetical protein NT023_11295 [Armatimonadetes bacterium]|nr:hypothetical protein [Armatimonadota bacterium]
MKNKKIPSESEFLKTLFNGELRLPPLTLRRDRSRPDPTAQIAHLRPDGVLLVNWDTKRERYVFEYKTSSSPRALAQAMEQAAQYGRNLNMRPMAILPYLSEEALHTLDSRGFSGIDLCGNGVLFSENFRIWRTGSPNQFSDSRPIKNPFQGDSSVFARCFLLQSSFSSLTELHDFARERTFAAYNASGGNSLSMSIASKAAHALIEEGIIVKQGKKLQLFDKQRLTSQLSRAYVPSPHKAVVGKTSLDNQKIWEALAREREANGLRCVAAGISSAGYYHVLAGVERLRLYTEDLQRVQGLLDMKETPVFANVELIEERSQQVYFDSQQDGNALQSSWIQTWLELSAAGTREQDAGRQLLDAKAKFSIPETVKEAVIDSSMKW